MELLRDIEMLKVVRNLNGWNPGEIPLIVAGNENNNVLNTRGVPLTPMKGGSRDKILLIWQVHLPGDLLEAGFSTHPVIYWY